MARSKSNKPASGPKKNVAASDARPLVSFRPLTRRRALAIVALGVVGMLAFGGQAAWKLAAPLIVNRERYLLRAESIEITPPPEWIAADVRGQVVHNAGLDGRLSVLDPGFFQAISNAFALHPWVKSVDQIEKLPGPGVRVALAYRQPVAVIDVPDGSGGQLLPVDDRGVHLPAGDVPLIRRQRLPRLTNIVGMPPEGQTWDDARVPGGVQIAMGLAPVWEAWHLDEIAPSTRLKVQEGRQFFTYTIVTRGGTIINWGAAPLADAPGEDEFSVKLARLKQCIQKHGPLNTPEAPGTIDVRSGIDVNARMVKELRAPNEADTQLK
jgi:hypothetical protein